jgi:hypothetical protein
MVINTKIQKIYLNGIDDNNILEMCMIVCKYQEDWMPDSSCVGEFDTVSRTSWSGFA